MSPLPWLLTFSLSIFTAAGGLCVAAAKKSLGPRISVFVVVVNIVRTVVNITVWSMEPEESADSRNNGDKRKCVPAGRTWQMLLATT